MQLRFAVCIPVYNHPKTVTEVVLTCLSETEFQILIVDDGSEPSVQSVLENHISYQNLSDSLKRRITLFRQPTNQGKGKALQTAIQKSVALGFTHLITLDADGQHDPKEINKLVKAAYEKPWSVILGDRQMQTANVPKSSVFGKAFSNFWVQYQTDKIVGDSQSGFRIYPLFYIQTMKFITRRYDFEVEVLTRLIWKDVEIFSVPISVKYFPPEQRVTHFNKFKDNFRLTVLNTILVIASLLRREDSPTKSAFATGLGVFVGCFPVYGLHTFIVGLLAFVLRMNFIYLFLGTQISIPPMVPVLIAGAHFASSVYLGHPPHGVFGLSLDWIKGITLFALALSFFLGFLTYLFKKSLQLKAKMKLSSGHSQVAVKSSDGPGISFMKWVLQKFGLKPAYFFLWFIVPYYYIFSRRARVSANEYWKVTHPEFSFFKRQVKVLQQIFCFAQVLVDRGYQRFSHENKFKVNEGHGIPKFFQQLKTDPKGFVMILNHFGGWEIAMSYFRYLNLNKKMIAVMYGIENSYQHSSVRKQDSQLQVVQFNKQSNTIMQLKNYLDSGDVVGLMGDRPVGRSYELVPLFGKLVILDSSALRLALMCKANIFFVNCVKTKNNHYEISAVYGDIDQSGFDKLNTEDKVICLLNEYAKNLENLIKQHPEQWFNFFPFWSEKIS